MKLDIGSIEFNLNIKNGGGTPSWGTELGQNSNYNFSHPGIEELLTSMVYCAVDKSEIYCPLGKGGSQQDSYDYILASVYNKVYVNDKLVPDAKFILLIVKKIKGDNHVGRRTLKYSAKMEYRNQQLNTDCFNKIKSVLNISENGSWFIYSLHTKNQDELHFDAIVADRNNALLFENSDDRKNYLKNLLAKQSFSFESNNSAKGAFNKIYYGVPGSGKSYKVNKDFGTDDYIKIRTTFHPEYTNADFVGQIIPKLHEDGDKSFVSYDFEEGPFTKALATALTHPNDKVVLIIEEINRGNASAIFGDIFQLLDRETNGESKYTINNIQLQDYINNEYELNLENIYIPSNLWLIGTMNTSDQNVFTLDTAFKRRWKMEYIPNKFENDDEYSKELRNTLIPNTDITWEKFVTEINNKIASNDSSINSEDKQLGMYFVTIEEVHNEKEFAEKILSYIWDDVAKIDTEDWFGDIKTYDKLLEEYQKESIKVFNNMFENTKINIVGGNDEQSDEPDTL